MGVAKDSVPIISRAELRHKIWKVPAISPRPHYSSLYQHRMRKSSPAYHELKGDFADDEHEHQARTRRIRWPVYIVAGELTLIAFALGFLFAVRRRGQIPLGAYAVEFFEVNPQIKTWLFTFVASVLSMFSSFLFAQAVRHALVVALSHPLRLSTLVSGVKISKRALILDKKYVKWGLLSVAIFGLGIAQTSSWSSLLTPNVISVVVPLVGTEIDLASAIFQQEDIWGALLSYDGSLSPANLTDASDMPVIQQSGAARAAAFANHTSILNYGGFTYTVTTGGISPIHLQARYGTDVYLPPNTADLSTTNTAAFPPSTNVSEINIVMHQQGLSANGSCQREALTEESTDSLPAIWREYRDLGCRPYCYTYVNISTPCGADVNSQHMVTGTNQTLAIHTKRRRATGSIVDGRKQYSGTFVCDITPLIVPMISNYTVDNSIKSTPDLGQPTKNGRFAGQPGVTAAAKAFEFGQGIEISSVGDLLVSIESEQGTLSDDQITDERRAQVLEAFLQGIFELSGTLMKNKLAQHDLQSSMTHNISGIANVQTLGWQYTTYTSTVVLIPILLFAITTLGIVAVAQWHNRGVPLANTDFDPNDPWLLMAAASAGGMGTVFQGSDKEDWAKGEENQVVLGKVNGRVGFLHADGSRRISRFVGED
ncbi:Protein arginine N-methyltransferase [Mycena kentingensis (nom. inval.)]|nr:Protein arginine N-methyltransferase [Mycena kentingensis (nom. inval.)]